jgi:mono/diheme cytochrome c family protein
MGLLLRSALILCAMTTIASADPPAPTPQLLELGKQSYALNCAACHGEKGDGKGPVAFAIKPPPRNFVSEPFKAGDTVPQIYTTLTNGLPNTKMVAYKHLPEEQRWALAYVVRAFRIK